MKPHLSILDLTRSATVEGSNANISGSKVDPIHSYTEILLSPEVFYTKQVKQMHDTDEEAVDVPRICPSSRREP